MLFSWPVWRMSSSSSEQIVQRQKISQLLSLLSTNRFVWLVIYFDKQDRRDFFRASKLYQALWKCSSRFSFRFSFELVDGKIFAIGKTNGLSMNNRWSIKKFIYSLDRSRRSIFFFERRSTEFGKGEENKRNLSCSTFIEETIWSFLEEYCWLIRSKLNQLENRKRQVSNYVRRST